MVRSFFNYSLFLLLSKHTLLFNGDNHKLASDIVEIDIVCASRNVFQVVAINSRGVDKLVGLGCCATPRYIPSVVSTEFHLEFIFEFLAYIPVVWCCLLHSDFVTPAVKATHDAYTFV